VKDAVNPSNGALHGLFVAYVALDEFHFSRDACQIVTVARAQIIEHAHAVPATHQGFGDMRTNESGAPGYQV
jgi:hypothetical protein